jgi:hypothetical protein
MSGTGMHCRDTHTHITMSPVIPIKLSINIQFISISSKLCRHQVNGCITWLVKCVVSPD